MNNFYKLTDKFNFQSSSVSTKIVFWIFLFKIESSMKNLSDCLATGFRKNNIRLANRCRKFIKNKTKTLKIGNVTERKS